MATTDRASKKANPTSGPWTSFLSILLAFIIIAAISTDLRYQLPKPKGLPRTHAALATDRPANMAPIEPDEFSEALANRYIDHLAGTIGYRIVGTQQMAESVRYLAGVLEEIQGQAGSGKQIEILVQTDDGAHLFEFMGKRVWKKYFGLQNLVVRVSDPAFPRSRHNAVLVNAHLDSTLPSPGAADDVAGVAVMVEAIRIIAQTPAWPMHNGIVFLFNGAEESLQDASHMFITKHPLKDIVRAVINLEACGTAGQEILFQATSTEMIEAYSKVPRPFGSVIATEVFRTGLIASDTDFRQFVQYGNLTGLDMAIMQNSYLYHTTQDIPSKIQPGTVQNMGENTIALLKYLTSEHADLTNIKPASSTVFFSGLGGSIFVIYSKQAALRIYTGLLVIAFTLATRSKKVGHHGVYLLAFLAVIGSLIGFLVAANVVAWMMSIVLNKALSWYRHECLPVLLFGPPALAGGLGVQYLFSSLVRKLGLVRPQDEQDVLSHATLCALMLFNGLLAVLGAYFHVGAAYLPAIGLVAMLSALVFNDFLLVPLTGRRGHIHLPAYIVAMLAPGLLGVEGLLVFLDLFVPMTGRMGHDVHVDFIIASLVSGVGFNVISTSLPLAHRFSRRALGRFLVVTVIVSSLVGVMFSRPSWKIFDEDHPKRLAVLHMENLTSSGESRFDLHIASMDRAPGFEELVVSLVDSVGLSDEAPVMSAINDEIPDWDIIYPVSQFLKSCQVRLREMEHQLMPGGAEGDGEVRYASRWREVFKVTKVFSQLDHVNRQRRLGLAIEHPGIIWTVVAFTADVVGWDLPARPGRGKQRHHVKEASGVGRGRWTLNMTLALTEVEFESAVQAEQIAKGQRPRPALDDLPARAFLRLGSLQLEFSGIDPDGLYPARPNLSSASPPASRGGPGLRLFSRLARHIPPWIDPFLLSAVSNTAVI